MDKKIAAILNACEEFIENSSPEELLAYEKKLNINYSDYIIADEYVDFVELNNVQIVLGEYNCGSQVCINDHAMNDRFIFAA